MHVSFGYLKINESQVCPKVYPCLQKHKSRATCSGDIYYNVCYKTGQREQIRKLIRDRRSAKGVVDQTLGDNYTFPWRNFRSLFCTVNLHSDTDTQYLEVKRK